MKRHIYNRNEIKPLADELVALCKTNRREGIFNSSNLVTFIRIESEGKHFRLWKIDDWIPINDSARRYVERLAARNRVPVFVYEPIGVPNGNYCV